MRMPDQQPLYFKAQVQRPRTILNRIKSIDAALKVVSKVPRVIEAQQRLAMRRAHLTESFLLMKGASHVA